mgnify:FL=1
MKKLAILGVALFLLGLVGEVKCIVKAINCNWEPIGKAEVIYTAGVFTGAGCVIGWFDIEDK